MDTFAYFDGTTRDAIGWKRQRIELADYMLSNANYIDITDDELWVDCFCLCGEDAKSGVLQAAPHEP